MQQEITHTAQKPLSKNCCIPQIESPHNQLPLAMSTDLTLPEEAYRHIEHEIESNKSPVGIDAKKTHVIILHKLLEIEARLDRIERTLAQFASQEDRS